MRRPAVLLLALFASCAANDPSAPAHPANVSENTVILISIDGFRPDYLERYEPPNLRRLASEGVHAPDGMIPVFPSKTFPGHYSIVTGLYPGHHGVVSNKMYDPDQDAWFDFRERSSFTDERWWGGEPIWVTAERQGLRTATFYWVGSEAPIGGLQPTHWIPYDGRIPGTERVDQVLRWLDLPPDERPVFNTLYFGDVDHQGHSHGPDSPEVALAVRRVDAHLGRLLEGLEQRELLDRVTLIIVSDHGMAATSPERVIALDDYIDLHQVTIVDLSPVLMLRPRAGREESVYAALKGSHPHLAVYRKSELPERWHFREHRRITTLVGVADEGWTIVRRRRDLDPDRFLLGMHGYDNALESMRALFVAKGPAFRRGFEAEAFEAVHLYELLSSILEITPAPNDGDPEAVERLLRTQ